mmetsp:Transcript_8348/g.12727  ORF Transcript_8348/g.12727 Transcript_8348/m.12727 type:complete len:110 (-) Transcript_8348:460-789(-)
MLVLHIKKKLLKLCVTNSRIKIICFLLLKKLVARHYVLSHRVLVVPVGKLNTLTNGKKKRWQKSLAKKTRLGKMLESDPKLKSDSKKWIKQRLAILKQLEVASAGTSEL